MDNFLTFRWFFEKSGSIRLLALVHVRLMTRSKNERISQFQKIDRTVVLETLFELRIDDVICMTHQRKVLKMKVQTQYFMNINREIHLGALIWLWDHFKKSKEFYQNIKTRTVSLKPNVSKIERFKNRTFQKSCFSKSSYSKIDFFSKNRAF